MSADTKDVVVVGGGAIGLLCAFRSATSGRKTTLLDAGELGREASWAGGGILSPVHPYAYPQELTRLIERSVELYPALARELVERTGTSIELRTTGLVRLAVDPADDDDLARAQAFRAERSLPAERLGPDGWRALGSVLPREARGALFEPGVAQIRNPRFLKALIAACRSAGVELAPHEAVTTLVRSGERVTGVETTRRKLSSGEVVLAAGAWSGLLAKQSLGIALPVEPVRGQMLLFEGVDGALDSMVLGAGGKYLIPRADGRVLAGSTLEHVGYDRRTTLDGIRALLAAALRLAPGLATAQLAKAWAGLRPGTPDRLPYVGRVRGLDGLVVATGHYRNGLVLAPVTGELVLELLDGRSPTRIEAFAPDRAPGAPAAD